MLFYPHNVVQMLIVTYLVVEECKGRTDGEALAKILRDVLCCAEDWQT